MREKLILVLDDDPTGIQTVHGLSVYMRWSVGLLRQIFEHDRLAYIQTNSRSLTEAEAVDITRDVMQLAVEAHRATGRDFAVISRSDSSLRGHFPAEPNAIRSAWESAGLPPIDGVIVCPFLPEAGRVTIDNHHYIRQPDGKLLPVAETEFARDAVFGYHHSDLTKYIEEKTGGAIPAGQVVSIPLEWLEQADLSAIRNRLLSVSGFTPVVINATDYRHLHTFVQVLREVEQAGKRFVFRTAASFVKVYGGITDRPLLSHADLMPYLSEGSVLTVAGSHTLNTTRQLNALTASARLTVVELDVPTLMVDEEEAERIVLEAVERCETAMKQGQHPLLMTSRQRISVADAEGNLAISQRISGTLSSIVRRLSVRPRAIIAKGGITSSDIAVQGLAMQKAFVLGQVRPTIPVVLTQEESRFPGLPYVIFPGNTGQEDDLLTIWNLLQS